MMGAGFKIRWLLVVSVRGGCRSARNHPLLVGMVCFLFLLYRSSPWLFSLLVSASPVLVCTALLLGTLLSFGQPNIPEIERDDGPFSHEIVTLKTGPCENDTVVAGIEDSFSERLSCEKRKEAQGSVVVDGGIKADGADGVKEDGLPENACPVKNTSRDVHFDIPVLREGVTERSDSEEENDIRVHDDKIGIEGMSWICNGGESQYRLIEGEIYHTIEVESGKIEKEHSDDHLETRSESKWKEDDDVGDNEDDDERDNNDDDDGDSENDDASMYSGSEHAESSSPDASMADIRPMLDELHPLLDEEELLVPALTRENSDIGSEHSYSSKSENLESDEDSKNGEAGNDDDADDLEEEEEAQGGKDDDSKTAITWTEDDQKNIMDLGTLELERNQRLENLIARRRARKNLGLMAEKSLIDLDYIDLPFNVPHIATLRQNPFDGTNDSYNNVGLPPIPGSAPSVMLKRRNPFDLPYEPNEEKPDLKGDSFQQEFTTHHQRDAIFRRHESFAVGPSNLGMFRKVKQDMKWRPYFVPEHFSADESNDHPIQRQLSEVTDSKASSEPDTESVVSLTDQDNKNANELDSSREVESVSCLDQDSPRVEDGTESSEDFKSPVVEEVEDDRSDRDENVIMLGNAESLDESESSYSEAMNASLESSTNGSPSVADRVETESVPIMLGNAETRDESKSSYSVATNASLDSNRDGSPSTADSIEPETMLIMLGNAETKDEPESSNSEATNASLDSNTDGSPSTADSVEPESMLIMLGNAETQDELESSYSEAMNVSLASKADGSPTTASTVDEESSSTSSSSFYSEVNESVPDVKREETIRPAVGVAAKRHLTNEDDGENVNFGLPRETVDENQQSEPVYDSSPPAIERYHSVANFPSDMHADLVEMGPTPGSVQNASDNTEGESLQENAPDNVMFASSSLLQAEGNRSVNQEVTEVMEGHTREANPSLVNGEIGNQNGSETTPELALTNPISPPSSDESTAGGRTHRLDSHDEHGNVHLPSLDVQGFDAAHHSSREHQDDFISPSVLKKSEVSKLEKLPSNGIEHGPSFYVDLETKEGLDSVEVNATEQGRMHPSAADGPVREGMELKVDNVEEDVQVEHTVYSSEVKEGDSLIQEVDLDAVDLPRKKEPSRLEGLLNQGNSVVKEESATEESSDGEDDTQEILESGARSLSDILTTSPHSVPTSDGAPEFLSPSGTLYYSDDSVHGGGLVTHDRVSRYSEHMEEAPESVGDVIVKERSERSTDAELTALSTEWADGTYSSYCPSETDKARSNEDSSPASVQTHKWGDSDSQMVSDSSYRTLDHGDLKNQVEERSGFSEARHVEVEETSDGIEELSQLKDHSDDPPEMEADEVSSFGQVHTSNDVATAVADTEMIKLSGLESNSSLAVLEARSVDDINMVFEQFRERAIEGEIILPSSAVDKTGKDDPQSLDNTSPSSQVVEPRSTDHVNQISADETDQPDDTPSDDKPAEDVAGEANSSAESTDVNDTASDLKESRNVSLEKAESSIKLDSASDMTILEATCREDTGTTGGLSHSKANAEDDVHSPVCSDLSMELGRHDGNSLTMLDVGSSETVRLPEVDTLVADKQLHANDAPAAVETVQEVAADKTKYIGLEPDPDKGNGSDALMPDVER